MRTFPNIERSAFRRGQFVGYSCSMPWRIYPARSPRGGWAACPADGSQPFVYELTLAAVSARLERLNVAYAARLRALTWFALVDPETHQ